MFDSKLDDLEVVHEDAHLLALAVPGVRFIRPAELVTELRLVADPD